LAARILGHSITHAASVNVLIVGVTSIASIVVARSLGTEGRGQYAAIMAWFALAQVMGEFGQSGAVTYWVAHEPKGAKQFVASARVLMLMAGGVVSVVGICISGFLAGGDSAVAIAYQIAFAGCILNSLCAGAVYALQSLSLWRWNIVRLTQPVAYVCLIIALWLTGVLNIAWLSIALVASIAIQFVIVAIQSRAVGIIGGNLARDKLIALARYGGAYSASAVPTSLSSQYDRLALSRTVQPSELGQYAVASTVAGLVAPFATAVASVMFPRTARAAIGEAARRATESKSLIATAGFSIGISAVLAIVAAPLVPIVFGSGFRPAVELVWWLAPAMVFRSISQVVSALLRGRQRPGLATYSQLSVLIVGGVVIFPSIALIGVRGAAAAIGIGEAVGLAIGLVMLQRQRRRAATSDGSVAR
jgi:O-antigen/teichoic acid export membrane protein